MVLSSDVAEFVDILCMWHTALQHFWCLHLYLFSLLTHMLRASSSVYPCGSCVTCRICFCIENGIFILLLFTAMPSIIASSLLIGQQCMTPWSNSSLLCGQSCIMYDLSFCRWASSCVAISMSSTIVHTGRFTVIQMPFTSLFMPCIAVCTA